MPASPYRTSIEGIKKMASITRNFRKERRDLESQSNRAAFETRHSIWWRLGVDLPILLILLALIGLFEFGVIPNHKGGFTCNDPALSHPFRGDTVTTEILMPTLLAVPLAIFIIVEYLFMDSDFLGQKRVRRALMNSYYLYRTYIYGLLFNSCIVEVMKGLIGSPRPTFFDLCEPDAAKTCNGTEFVSDFKCTPNKYSSWYQMDSYRSFPSGHSSLSVYCGFFLAWYLQRRAFNWQHRIIFLVPALQMLCISYAAVCSLTRITDHRHHWWDVLVGTIIGLAAMCYSVMLTNNFMYDHSRRNNDVKSVESRITNESLVYDERRRVTTP